MTDCFGMDLPSLSRLKALRVVDLKQKLAEIGLPQSGLKADLVARLDAHYNSIRSQQAQQFDVAMQQQVLGTTLHQSPMGATFQQPAVGTSMLQPNMGPTLQEPPMGGTFQHPALDTTLLQPDMGPTLHQSPMGGTFQQPAMGTTPLQPDIGTTLQQSPMGGTFQHPALDTTLLQQDMGTTLQQPPMGDTFPQSAVGTTPLQPDMGTTPLQPDMGTTPLQPDMGTTPLQPDMVTTPLQPDMSTSLQQSPMGGTLQHPALDTTLLPPDTGTTLQQSPMGSTFQHPALDTAPLQPDTGSTLQKSPMDGTLQQPALDAAPLQPDMDTTLQKSPMDGTLQQPTLDETPLQPDTSTMLQKSPMNGTLQQPTLDETPLQPDTSTMLQKSPMNGTLQQPTLDEAPLQPDTGTTSQKSPMDGTLQQPALDATPSQPRNVDATTPQPALDTKTTAESEISVEGDKKRKKKKKKKKNRPEEWARLAAEAEKRKQEQENASKEPVVEIEYVQEKLEMDPSDPMYRTFCKIFDAFKIVKLEDEDGVKVKEEEQPSAEELKKVPKLLEEDDMIEEKDDDDDDKPKLSKKKLKKLNRLSVAELKQLVSRPDVVEMHDVTARDPKLLVHLKSTRNTVPVPRHWCFKRKYLQGKRGIEKPPFDLPDFIKKTGIMEMRAALQEKEESKNLKAKMREKVRPKLGKIDIDYQKLHDAFFKWQTKPKMTLHGDLYYEGKEFEIRLKEKKPGDLSDDLRTALGMPVGPNAHKVPPPWLIAMQRYGPPPSYPNLKVPGLNAPIPENCSFGYHAGGWGKPPVDESGKPLYGDVFGTSDGAYSQSVTPEEIDTSLWGEIESESEEEESEEEENEEEDEVAPKEAVQAGLQTPVAEAGLTTPSGLSSVGLGQETPELLELRKKRIEAEMEGGETPSLYTVLPEKRAERVGASMMGSTHTYDVRKGSTAPALDTSGVELALNPEEVDLMNTEAMAVRAEAALREKQASLAKEDLSDMVAEHAAKQSSKRKRLSQQTGKEEKGAKRFKDFKF